MVITSHSSRITLHWKWMASSLAEIVKSWLKCCAYGEELGGGLVAVHWDGGSDVEGVQHIPAEAVPGYWGELLFHSSLRTTATLTSLKPTQMTIQQNLVDLSTPKTSQEVVIWLHRHETTFIIGLTSQLCREIAFFEARKCNLPVQNGWMQMSLPSLCLCIAEENSFLFFRLNSYRNWKYSSCPQAVSLKERHYFQVCCCCCSPTGLERCDTSTAVLLFSRFSSHCEVMTVWDVLDVIQEGHVWCFWVDVLWTCGVPVDETEVFLQVICVHVALAQLQLCTGIIMDVIDTHLFHDPKTALRKWENKATWFEVK